MFDPMFNSVKVQVQSNRLQSWVVVTHYLNKSPLSCFVLFSNNNSIMRILFSSVPTQTYS